MGPAGRHLLVTVAGIFVFTSLIGLIASSIDQRIAALGKGRSPVLESGHVLVLGWSSCLFSILSELIEANANQKDAAVVILAEESKSDMEDAVRARIGDTGTTRIICRTGDPASPADLALVNVAGARSVVVLAARPARATPARCGPRSPSSPRRPSAARRSSSRCWTAAMPGRCRWPPATGSSRLRPTTSSPRSRPRRATRPGSASCTGSSSTSPATRSTSPPPPSSRARTFGDALLAYERSSVIGRAAGDGSITLAPAMGSTFEAGDRVIAISADDDTIVFGGINDVAAPAPPRTARLNGSSAGSMLVVGWSALGARILAELDAVATGPRTVDVAVTTPWCRPTPCRPAPSG